MAEWLRHPPVETLVVTGSDPGLAKNLFLHFFLTKMNTVKCRKKCLPHGTVRVPVVSIARLMTTTIQIALFEDLLYLS